MLWRIGRGEVLEGVLADETLHQAANPSARRARCSVGAPNEPDIIYHVSDAYPTQNLPRTKLYETSLKKVWKVTETSCGKIVGLGF